MTCDWKDMIMETPELIERLKIEHLLVRYCYAFDDRNWTDFEVLFTPDAALDYSELDGPVGDVKSTIEDTKAKFPDALRTQHSVSSMLVNVTGRTATASTVCHALATQVTDLSKPGLLFALWYQDVLVRTADGWRIRERVARKFGLFEIPVASPAVA